MLGVVWAGVAGLEGCVGRGNCGANGEPGWWPGVARLEGMCAARELRGGT
jgi:hypothetical protein